MEKTKKDFLSFYNNLAKYIKVNHPRICFYGYGSCFNKPDAIPSDLDGGMIATEIITNKKEISEISEKMLELARNKNIKYSPLVFQFNFLDLVSGKDGRFLSYDPTYISFLQKYGVVLSGPNLLNELNGINNKYGELNSFAFNFRGVRNDFLHLAYFSKEKKELDKIKKIKSYLKACPKKIRLIEIMRENKSNADELIADELYSKSKKDFIKESKSKFPNFNWELFDKITNAQQSDLEKSSKNNLINIWGEALSVFEMFVNLTIELYPVQKRSIETLI